MRKYLALLSLVSVFEVMAVVCPARDSLSRMEEAERTLQSPYGAVFLPGGDFLIGGGVGGMVGGYFGIVKFHADGSIDSSFGDKGRVKIELPCMLYPSIVALPNGKILGYWAAGWKEFNSYLFQLNPDGSFDLSFGTKGQLKLDITNGSIAVDSAGKAIVFAQTISMPLYQFVSRYNDDGSLDKTFGDGGTYKIVTPYTSYNMFHPPPLVLSDGKILIRMRPIKTGKQNLMVRLLQNGTLDTSFGHEGIRLEEAPDTWQFSPLPDGKFLAFLWNHNTLVTRYSGNGVLDAKFGKHGFLDLGTPFPKADWLRPAITTFVNGETKILGHVDYDKPSSKVFLAQFNLDGSLDKKFSATIPFEGAYSGIEVNPIDQKILVLGSLYYSKEHSVFKAMRFNSNGSLDKDFGTSGAIIMDFDSLPKEIP